MGLPQLLSCRLYFMHNSPLPPAVRALRIGITCAAGIAVLYFADRSVAAIFPRIGTGHGSFQTVRALASAAVVKYRRTASAVARYVAPPAAVTNGDAAPRVAPRVAATSTNSQAPQLTSDVAAPADDTAAALSESPAEALAFQPLKTLSLREASELSSDAATDGTPTNAVWTGGSPDFNNWSDSRNWEDGQNPSGAGSTIINFAGSNRLTSNNDYGAYTQFNQILFSPGAGSFNLTGSAITLASNGGLPAKIQNDSVNPQTVSFNTDGNSIVFNTSGELNPVAGNLTINNTIVFDGGGVLSVYGNGGHTLTLNGSLNNGAATTSLVNQNNNIVVLNAVNGYTGTTAIHGGRLELLSGTIGNNSSVFVGNGATIGTAASLLLTDPDGGLTAGNTITINPGTVSGNQSNRTIGGTNTTGTNTFSGAINLAGSFGENRSVNLTAAAGGTVDFTGVISGSGQAVIKIGLGTVTLANTGSTYTGGTFINEGVLSIASTGAIGSSGGVTFNGGTLRLTNPGSISTSRQLTFNSTGIIDTAGATVTSSGLLTGAGGLTKLGNAALTVSGTANNYAGATSIQAGTLRLGANNALPTTTALALGSGTTNASGILELNGFSQELAGLTTAGTGTANRVVNGSSTLSTLTLNLATGSGSFGGILGGTTTAQNNFAFVKSGSGTLSLTGVNTYTGGTTINGGVLAINSTSSLGASTGSTTINAGTLQATANISTTRNLLLGSASSSISVDPNTTYSLAGTVNNVAAQIGSLTKSGAGTLTLTGNNTYSGDTRVSAGTLTAAGAGANKALGGTNAVVVERSGTLLLGADDQIRSKADVTLGSVAGAGMATLNTGGFSQGLNARLGALTLAGGTASVIDFASASGNSILSFASSFLSSGWDGTLSIYNWTGTQRQGGGIDQLYFGISNTGLSSAQLNQITFYSDAGNNPLGTGMFASDSTGTFTGEVVPVPEPSTYLAGALALLAVGYTQRQRFVRQAKRAS